MDKNKNNFGSSSDLSGYKDLSGVTLGKLSFGVWIVTHRKQFILGVIAFLVALSSIFWGYSLYSYVYYLVKGRAEDKKIAEELSKNDQLAAEIRERNKAEKIIEYPPIALSNNGLTDFVGKINNPNSKFYLNFSYCFVAGGKELSCGSSFILPSETKYLLSLANKKEVPAGGLSFVMKDLNWQRLDLHEYPNWPAFLAEHIDFTVSNVSFKNGSESGLTDKLSLNVLEFTVTNNSAYSYWSVPFNIILTAGNSIVGANRYEVNDFEAGSSRIVKIVWPETINVSAEVQALPEINLVEPGIYKKL